MRRRAGGVFADVFAQAFAIDERVIEFAAAHLTDDVGEVLIDRLVREQPQIQFALHLFREFGPVAPHHFHADELDVRRSAP